MDQHSSFFTKAGFAVLEALAWKCAAEAVGQKRVASIRILAPGEGAGRSKALLEQRRRLDRYHASYAAVVRADLPKTSIS